MSFFDEVAKETMGQQRHPKWERDQTYHMRIDKYEPTFQTRQSGTCTVFEFTVLSSSCREHPRGQKLSLLIFHNADSAKGNLAKMLRAALGVPQTAEGKLYYETTIQPHAAAYCQDAKYFEGKEITVTTETRISKEKRQEYVYFHAEPLRKAPDGTPEPLAERETKPPIRRDAAPLPPVPAGYAYPPASPAGYAYPPASPVGYPPAYPPAYPPPGYKPPGT